MTNQTKVKPPGTTLTQDLVALARYGLTRKRSLLLIAVGLVAAGMVLNWGWLVAAGVAPMILGVLPCVAMCALGLCMTKKSGAACQTENPNTDIMQTLPTEPNKTEAFASAPVRQIDLDSTDAQTSTPQSTTTAMPEPQSTQDKNNVE